MTTVSRMRFSPGVAYEVNDDRPTTSSFSCFTGGVNFVYGSSWFDFSVQASLVLGGGNGRLLPGRRSGHPEAAKGAWRKHLFSVKFVALRVSGSRLGTDEAGLQLAARYRPAKSILLSRVGPRAYAQVPFIATSVGWTCLGWKLCPPGLQGWVQV